MPHSLQPETTPPRHRRRAETYSVVAAVAFVGVFGVATVFTGGQERLVHLAHTHWAVIAGLLGLSLVNYGARTLRWHIFSRRAEVRVSLQRNALYFISGFAMIVTPGKIGEVLRLWLLQRHYGYAYAQTTPVLLADRLSDFAGMLLLCSAGVVAFTGFLPLLAAVMGATAGGLLLLLRPFLLVRILRLFHQRMGWLRRPLEFAQATLQHAGRLRSRRLYVAALLLSGAGWLAEGAGFYWLLATLGADVSPLQAIFVFAFAMLVGALTALPGGLGGTEATMSALLVALGVELELALIATAIIRVTTLWFAVAIGFVALVPALRPPKPAHAASAWAGNEM